MTTEEQPEIRRYRVYLTGIASTVVEVEVNLATLAEDEDPMERATEEAYAKNRAGLCHQCAHRMNPPEEWNVGEPLSENIEELS